MKKVIKIVSAGVLASSLLLSSSAFAAEKDVQNGQQVNEQAQVNQSNVVPVKPNKGQEKKIEAEQKRAEHKAQLAALKQEIANMKSLQQQAEGVHQEVVDQVKQLKERLNQAITNKNLSQIDQIKSEMDSIKQALQLLQDAKQNHEEVVKGVNDTHEKVKGQALDEAIAAMKENEQRIQTRINDEQQALQILQSLK